MVVDHDPYDAEQSDNPLHNGSMLLVRNDTVLVRLWNGTTFPYSDGTNTMAGSEAVGMLDLYRATVGGVIVVGGIFTIGIIAALAFLAWRAVSVAADLTVECLIWTQYRCRESMCCASRTYTVDAPEQDEETLGDYADDRSDPEPESLRVAE